MTTKKIHIIIWNPHHIEPLIKMGLTHFIIMHPTFCVGYPEKTNYFDEETLKNLKNKYPKLSIAVLADRLYHQEHLDTLDMFLTHNTYLDSIHIQDLGALRKINKQYPSLKCCWIDSFMSMNHLSLETISHFGASSIVLSHQLPLNAIKIPQTLKGLVYVQGPILIQYAKRRYFEEANLDKDSHFDGLADDKELPGRAFRFIQSEAGTAMYAHFDRSLLSLYDKLDQTLDWLIDARFYTLDQLKIILNAYKNPKPNQTLQPLLETPQRPGFFLANKTNNDWRNQKMGLKASSHIIGEVISTADEDWMIIESLKPIKPNTKASFISPIQIKQKRCLDEIYALDGSKLIAGHNQTLIKLKKIKHITEKSLVILENSSE